MRAGREPPRVLCLRKRLAGTGVGLEFRGFQERLEPSAKTLGIRTTGDLSRNQDARPVNFLKSMPEHWTVLFFQDVAPDDDPVVRPDPYVLVIESRMMNLAHR